MQEFTDNEKIIRVLNTYALACDTRNWALCDDVFTDDVIINYGGEFKATGRAKIVGLLKSMLGGCGPTQHLLGNFFIHVDGNIATCACYVRAFHAGKGAKKAMRYEVWGEYKDELICINGQWKIFDRKMLITHEEGSRDILGPE